MSFGAWVNKIFGNYDHRYGPPRPTPRPRPRPRPPRPMPRSGYQPVGPGLDVNNPPQGTRLPQEGRVMFDDGALVIRSINDTTHTVFMYGEQLNNVNSVTVAWQPGRAPTVNIIRNPNQM